MTERITNAMLSASTLRDVNASLAALQRSSSELSSGHTILEPSDNPYGASRAIDLQSQLDGLGAFAKSTEDGIAWANGSESAMANMSEAVQRVRTLLVQASNGTLNAGDLKNISAEVKQLTESIKQAANTQYAGQYVFAGALTTTRPYAQGESDEYQGDEGTIARSIGPGASVTINTNISALLGDGQTSKDGKLLDVLRTIAQHLSEGTPEAKAALNSSDLKALDANAETLSGLQATNGSTSAQLHGAKNRNESMQTSITAALSSTEDADFAKTSIAYSNERAAYEAALRAGASIVQESLLNFLH
jgi:flagellar hook-associated protein 3 FlgL